jgi:polyribonucleotide 5'-hydroxyl-kinase
MFGSELASNIEYTLSGRKTAIYTWHGCDIQITGSNVVEYVACDTPMQVYLNAHLALQQRRLQAKKEGGNGPRVMIVGPSDVGKTSVCKILLSYAVKMESPPLFVDIDTNEVGLN